MFKLISLVLVGAMISACSAQQGSRPSVLDTLEERAPSRGLSTPSPRADHGLDTTAVEQGRYLVDLMGCASCHTDGAMVGAPNAALALAGSRTGIAFTNPLDSDEPPGVIYPPNLTPDPKTGLGEWSVTDIAAFLRTGMNRHGTPAMTVMPWPAYAKLKEADALAIGTYLKSLTPVQHAAPKRVPPGVRAKYPFVYFSVYTSKSN